MRLKKKVLGQSSSENNVFRLPFGGDVAKWQFSKRIREFGNFSMGKHLSQSNQFSEDLGLFLLDSIPRNSHARHVSTTEGGANNLHGAKSDICPIMLVARI